MPGFKGDVPSSDKRASRGWSSWAPVGLGFLIAATGLAISPSVAEAQTPGAGFEAFAMGYLVQSVCIDGSGRVMQGVSPLSPACHAMRSLQLHEPLPYHKHDWPSARGGAPLNPLGMQRSDSFPTVLGGSVVVAQTFDFGGGTRAFGVFDSGDGGQIVKATPQDAAIILTQDHPDQIKFFFGPACGRANAMSSIEHSWVLFNSASPQDGAIVAHLRQTLDNGACPKALDSSLARWRITEIRYRGALNQTLTRALQTLVTDHFSQPTVGASGSMERMYLTRELGWTRWERWQNLSRAGPQTDAYASRAQMIEQSGRCDSRFPKPEDGDWAMVDCREWTNIQPSAAPLGDPPTFWTPRLQGLISSAGPDRVGH